LGAAEVDALVAKAGEFAKMGAPSKEDAQLEIALRLRDEGLSPFGEGAAEYKRRLDEETQKVETAERLAMEAVAGVRRPRTPDFSPRRPIVGETTIAKDPTQVEAMGGFEAVGAALAPQVLETPAETDARLKQRENEELFEKEARFLSNTRGFDLDEAKARILKGFQEQFLLDASKNLDMNKEEQKQFARNNYLQYLQEELPDEYRKEVQRDTGEAAFGIAGTEVSGRARATAALGRGAAALVGFVASDRYDPDEYKRIKEDLGITPQTDAVVESLPMTAVRDLAGLSRFVLNPLLDLAFYDIDPATGKQVDPNEFGFLPRERTGRKEEGAFGRSYIAGIDPGPVGAMDRQLREIAVEIATARSLGDDLAAQSAVKPEDEKDYRGIGMLAEVALPINLFKVPGAFASGATAVAKRIPGAMKLADAGVAAFPRLASAAELAADPFRIPVGLFNASVLNKELIEPLRRAAASADRIIDAARPAVSTTPRIADEIAKSPKLLDKLVDSNRVSTVAGIQAGDKYTVMKWFADNPSGAWRSLNDSFKARLRNDAPDIVKVFDDGSPYANRSQEIAKAFLQKAATDEKSIAKKAAALAKIPARMATEAEYFAVRQSIRTSIIDDLAQTQLGSWSYLTPNVVASTRIAKKFVPELSKKTTESLDEIVAPLSFKLNKPLTKDFLQDLLDASVIKGSSARDNYYKKLLGDGSLKQNDIITGEQYKALSDLVAENEIYNLSRTKQLGAFAPERAGRVIASADTPEEVRSTLLQTAAQFGENVKMRLSIMTNNKYQWLNPENVPQPKYIDDVTKRFAGFIETLPAQLAQEIRRIGQAGKVSSDEIVNQLIRKGIGTQDAEGKVAAFPRGIVDTTASSAGNVQSIDLLPILKAQFGLDPNAIRDKQIINDMTSLLNRNSDLTVNEPYAQLQNIRNQMLAIYPALKAQQPVALGTTGARTLKRDSLLDTTLTYITNATQDKELARLVGIGRNRLLDQAYAGKVDPKELPLLEALMKQDLTGQAANITYTAMKRNPEFAGIPFNFYRFIELKSISNAFKTDALRRTPVWLATTPEQALIDLNMGLQRLSDTDEYILLPSAFKDDLKVINENLKMLDRPAVAQKFINTMNDIERQEPGIFNRVLNDSVYSLGRTHSTLIEGMLAGRGLPNLTYLSENVITAPLISLVTNPSYIYEVLAATGKMGARTVEGFAGGPFSRFGGSAEAMFDAARNAPDAIAFKSPRGEYTNKEVWELFTTARLGTAAADAATDPNIRGEIKALINLWGDDKGPLGRIQNQTAKRFRDFIPAGDTISIPTQVATQTDYAFRAALFQAALKNGATADEAAAIARETLLDYGLLNRLLPAQLQEAKRPFLFLTFTTTMSLAILKALTRGEPAENILRMARYHRNVIANQAKDIYAPGQQELEAIWMDQVEMKGGYPTTYTYLRDPIMGQIFWAADMLDQGLLFIFKDQDRLQPAIETFEDLGYTPLISFMKDLLTATPGAVPPRHVALAQMMGLWPSMISAFNIEEAPIGKMRPGDPTFEGKQYRFANKQGKQGYITFLMGLTTAGWNRTLNDYFNTLVASGVAPEGAYLARYYPDNTQFEGVQEPAGGWVNGLLYMVVRQRAVKPPSQVEVYDRNIQMQMRALKDMQRKEVIED